MNVVRAYEAAPRAVQHLAVSARGLQVGWQRTGGRNFRSYLEEYERNASAPGLTEQVQATLLLQALERARAQAPAYRDLATGRVGLDDFPVVTKAEVAASPAAYELANRRRLVDVSTGGSTGAPLRFVTTTEAIRRQWAIWWRYRRWHGISLDTWCGHFGGRSVCSLREDEVFWRYNVPGRQVQFSARHLAPETVGRYVAEINRRRIPWLHGLPSTIGQLASLMAEVGLRFTHDLRWVTFGSENVPTGVTELVRRVLEVEPRQHYGLAEGVANFSECPDGRLHVDEDYAVVEFQRCEPSSEGDEQLFRVVGTSLTNTAQAFIRYDTTDLVSGVEAGCGCGRPGRTVGAIDGRTASYAVLPSGRRVGPISHVFRDLAGVVQGQVFVTSAGALVFHVVAGEGYGPDVVQAIRVRVAERAIEPVPVAVHTRPALFRAANGKVPVVVQGEPPP